MPKRLETTLTSSGWETKYAIRRLLFAFRSPNRSRPLAKSEERMATDLLLFLLLQPVNQLVDLRGRQVLVKLIIHHQRRRPRACADALDLLQMEQPIGSRFLVADAQLLLAVFEDAVGPAQQAAHIGAHLEVVLADQAGTQHRVIADDVAHFQIR